MTACFATWQKGRSKLRVANAGQSQPLLYKDGRCDKIELTGFPLGIFEDETGPPSYHLNREADVTILFVKQNKVVLNLAYQQNGLTAAEVKKAMELVSGMMGK